MTLYIIKDIDEKKFKDKFDEFAEAYDLEVSGDEIVLVFKPKLKMGEHHAGCVRLLKTKEDLLCSIYFYRFSRIKQAYKMNIVYSVLASIMTIASPLLILTAGSTKLAMKVLGIVFAVAAVLLTIVQIAMTSYLFYRASVDEKSFIGYFEEWFKEYI